MRILFLGDIIGRPGREVVAAELPALMEKLKLDFVIANGENAAGGFGLTRAIANDLFALGIDVLTTGNHWLDQREILTFIGDEDRVLRPRNYPRATPGRGANVYQAKSGQRVLVINAMGRVYMEPLDDPFAAVDEELRPARWARAPMRSWSTCTPRRSPKKWRWAISAIRAPAWWWARTRTCRPRTRRSCPGGTAFQGDAGACCDFDSVIGMDKEEPLQRFTTKVSGGRMKPAERPRHAVRRVRGNRRQDGARPPHRAGARGPAAYARHSRGLTAPFCLAISPPT